MAISPGIADLYVQADLKFVFQLATPLTNMTQIDVIGRSFILMLSRTPQAQSNFLRKVGKAHPCDWKLSHLLDSNLRSSTVKVTFLGNLVTLYPFLLLG